MSSFAANKTTARHVPAEQLSEAAWIGDAVLSLYARLKILREDGKLNGEKCVRMTSNQFLSAFGEPTKVEAEIGRVYEQAGLQSAFAFIEENLMPVFERQEEKRRRKLPIGGLGSSAR